MSKETRKKLYHSIPYRAAHGKLFDKARAGRFVPHGRLIVGDGEEIELTKE